MMTELSTGEQPPSSLSSHSTLLTFLIADVRGYTRFTVEQGDEAAARLADRFAALCEEILHQYEGRVIELRGDEALAVFTSARSALRGAVALQKALERSGSDDSSLSLMVGMGLDAGESIPVRGGYRGGALNLAARLCSIAGGGEILASEGVIHLARRTEGLAFVDRGHVTFKGLNAPIRVLQVAPEGEIPADLPPLQSILVLHPTNLPDDPTPFVGREGEIAAIVALLQDPYVRLVTLTGPAGTGKTRLALQVGNALLDDFQDGVFFCDLSALSDPTLVPSALAQVLSVKEESSRNWIETLVDRLKDRRLLLILDNFEHLLDGCAVVADLLDGCRDLHILVTSQIPLHLSREQEHGVPPLSVPDPRKVTDAASLSQYESVALFVHRARAVKDSFAMTDENALAIAEICSRLDGLPLAIELAAARIKLFPVQALLQRLSSRLRLLTGGARDRPTRQQTLRGAIDWSYSLLNAEEQLLFARLSVFAGGWTFEAAEAICKGDGEMDLLEGMASLVDKSLIRQEGEENPRFNMLETIREYARERLDERTERQEVRAVHARHFLDVVVEARRHFSGPDLVTWLDRLEDDHDNLRVALRWAIDQADSELGMRLAQELSYFWYFRGYVREGRSLGDEVLERSEYDQAQPVHPLRNQSELNVLRARLLERIGILALFQGDYEAARAYLEDGLRLSRQVGDPSLLVAVLPSLGFVARVQEDYDVAHSALTEGLSLGRMLGDTLVIANTLHHLGLLALEANKDFDAAWALNEQSLALYREAGDPRMVGVVLGHMGRVEWGRGNLLVARALLIESVVTLRDIGNLGPMTMMLSTLAGVDAAAGQIERAVRLQAAATQMEQIVGAQVWPTNRRERDGWLGLVHSALSDADFVHAWTEGQEMSAEQAVAYALDESG